MEPLSDAEHTLDQSDAHKPLRRHEMWNQLTNAITLQSSEDHVLWVISGIFWAANTVLLVALFSAVRLPPNPAISIVVSSVGVLLSLTWHIIQKRAMGHLKRFEELVRKLESELAFDPKFATSQWINEEDYKKFLGDGPSAKKLIPLCSKGGVILWALGLTYFILASLHLI